MKKNNLLTVLLIVLISSFTISVLYTPNENGPILAQNEESSGISEGNSTYLDSKASGINDRDISTVIVIPNPQSSSSNQTQNSSGTGKDERLNADIESKDDSESAFPLTLQEVPRQNESIKSSSTSNTTQRGEYKVDDNGVHYYDINNCSLIKGSSGVGNLSECQDAERVNKEELAG